MHLYSSKCGSACPRSRIYYDYFVVVFVMFNRTIIQIGPTIWFEYSALYITCRSVHHVNKPHPSQILVYIWPEQMLDGKFKLIDFMTEYMWRLIESGMKLWFLYYLCVWTWNGLHAIDIRVFVNERASDKIIANFPMYVQPKIEKKTANFTEWQKSNESIAYHVIFFFFLNVLSSFRLWSVTRTSYEE